MLTGKLYLYLDTFGSTDLNVLNAKWLVHRSGNEAIHMAYLVECVWEMNSKSLAPKTVEEQ